MNNNIKFIEAESTKQIKLGAIISYISIGVNILAGLLYTPWMVREIGQNDFGLYSLATSLISIFLIDFGLSAAVSKFVSKYYAEGDQESVDNILGIAYKFYFIIGTILFVSLVIIFIFIDTIYKELTISELNRFKVIYIIAALFSVISFQFMPLNGILISYEKFVKLRFCDLLNKIFSIILIIVALLLQYGLYALVTANAISGLITIGLKIYIIKRNTPIRINFKHRSRAMIKEIFSFSIWSTIVSICQRLTLNITPTLLGVVSGAISISLFAIGSLIEAYVFTIANALNGLFLSKVTRIINNDNSSSVLINLMIRIGRIQLLIIGLIFIGFISVGKDFILLWMGEGYAASYYITIFLIIPTLIELPQFIGNTAIVVLNKMRMRAYVFIIVMIINIVLSILLSWLWDALGASIAICFSYLLRSIGMNIVFNKSLKLDVFKFFKECHLKLFLPLTFSLVLGIGIGIYIPGSDWFYFILKCCLIFISYLTIIWFIGLNLNEKSMLLNTFRRILKKFSSKLKGKSYTRV